MGIQITELRGYHFSWAPIGTAGVDNRKRTCWGYWTVGLYAGSTIPSSVVFGNINYSPLDFATHVKFAF